MKSSKQIVAIVGTVDPEDRDIPFIPLEELISGRAINYIRRILDLEDTTYKPNNNYIAIQPYVDIFSNHGPFCWGKDPLEAVYHAKVLEEVAKMAIYTMAININVHAIDQTLLDKHFLRKHGSNAYYGQN